MFLVEFEPMIPVFERAKPFHAFGRTTTVIGYKNLKIKKVNII
jgi:hypothetical protein